MNGRELSVLHVITRIDRGGSAEVVLDVAARQRAKGHRVTLVMGRSEDPQVDPEEYAARTGVEVVRLDALRREVSPLRDLWATAALWRLIRRRRPDVVHTHTSKAGFVGRLAAKLAGAPAIVHSPHGHIFYGYYGPLKTRLFIWLERLAARLCDRITTLTDLGAADHVKLRIAGPEKFVTIRPGVDLSRFRSAAARRPAARKRLNLRAADLAVGWVGRLVPIKDCATFLRASARWSGAQALIVGDGPLRPELEALAAELNAPARFLGARSDVPDLMAAMDVFALSSVNEGFGRVLVEAMASGLPVVATAVGGVPEVVEHEQTGLLTRPGDPAALAEAVQRLLDNPELRAAYGRRGRRRADAFSIEQTVEDFERLYLELLRRGHSPRRGA